MEIRQIYTQDIPALRFIGVKYGDGDSVNGSFGAKWGEAFGTGLFGKIEAAAGGEEKIHALYEDGDAYIGLMRWKEGEPFEYWIGMFTAPKTAVPEGLGFVDFPMSKLGVGWIYGDEKTGELYGHEGDVMKMLADFRHYPQADENGMMCCFERYQCPRFTTPDENGCVILDLCFFI